MAIAVAEALQRNGRLVVEAGTGVGKSLAYLLPGALWASEQGRRLTVSTHTRALQEQIMGRELPVVSRVLGRLGRTLRTALLMGGENYLCVRRLERLARSPAFSLEPAALVLEELRFWTRTADTALRSCIPFSVPQDIWRRVCRDAEFCGRRGRICGRCLYRLDRRRAENSQVLVVNHALLLSGARLPPAGALVIDEAHSLLDAAAGHLGACVTVGRFLSLGETAADLARRIASAGGDAEGALAAAERRARLLVEAAPGFLGRVAADHGFRERSADAGAAPLEGIPEEVEPAALPELEGCLVEVLRRCPDAESDSEVRSLQANVAALRRDLREILSRESLDVARWVEWRPVAARADGEDAVSGADRAPRRFAFSLRAEPLEVSGALAERLWAQDIPLVLTSATLSAGRGLGEFKAAVGLPEARALALDSPFDFRSQAGLLILDGLPEPADEAGYAAAVAQRCRELIPHVSGGVFILFSSWRMLRQVHGLLRLSFKDRLLAVQGDSGSEALLNEFKAAGNAVLLGVDTFWQGVDVPGAALSCVMLAKLPFPNYASPLEAARRRWYESCGRSYFEDWSLPRAVMKLRQGFGRLIRGASDRGAVVILDSRILHKGYGDVFLDALPSCRRLSGVEDFAAFFSKPDRETPGGKRSKRAK